MKKEGIYTSISPYWSAELKHVPASWGIEGWPEDQSPVGLLFFNPRLQEGYKAWLKALLAPPNPYTGIPLAKDPALGDDPAPERGQPAVLDRAEHQGQAARAAGQAVRRLGQGEVWHARGGSAPLGWRWTAGGRPVARHPGHPHRLGVHPAPSGGLKKRLDDQLQFFAETMYRFNAEIARYLREDLGCKQLINAGNWRTADSIRLNDAERWSYTANEVLAVNRYYSPVHIGPDRGWRINKGDRFENVSVLFNPRALPLNLKQVVGHPMMVTETHWVPPLGYQSEAPFLAAAYQSLTGVDVFFWFGTGETEWSNRDRAAWDSASRAKWTIATPMMLGQFPAAALLFRRGDVTSGQPAVVEHRSLEQIWERVPPIIAEEPDYDPNRDQGDTARRSQLAGGVDPLAFLVGPVEVVYGSDPAKTHGRGLEPLHRPREEGGSQQHRPARLGLRPGPLHGRRPRAQGATGFLRPVGPIKLGDVTIRSENQYATVLVVSLDGTPLARSGRVLVQVGTRARPTGWADHAVTFTVDGGRETIHGRQIDNTGTMPWVIAATRVTIEVRNASLTSATLLDINGNARHGLPLRRAAGTIELELPKDAFYVVLGAR